MWQRLAIYLRAAFWGATGEAARRLLAIDKNQLKIYKPMVKDKVHLTI